MQEKKSGSKKILIWSLIAVILIVFAVLIFSGRLFNTDALRRVFAYMSEDKNSAGQLSELKFVNQQSSAFADYGGGIAIASPSGGEIIGMSGDSVAQTAFTMSTPAVLTAGERAVFYDIGGTELRVLDSGAETLSLSLESPIVAASLNSSGYLTVVSGESGYKAAVTVYNDKSEQVFKFYVSSSNVLAARVSPDNSFLVVAGVMYTDGSFCTKLVRYNLDSDEEVSSVYIQDSAVLKLEFISDDVLCAVTDSSLLFFTKALEHMGTYDTGSAYLINAEAGGGYMAVLLREQKSGNRARVVTLNSAAEVTGELEIGREVLDISAAGKYVALLYSDTAEIYTSDMEQYNSTDSSESARSVIMRNDGTMLLVTASSARLFVG